MAEGGNKRTFSAGEVKVAADGGRLDSWRDAGFFAPAPAPAPVAPNPEQVRGRQYDYGQGFNLVNRPRQEEQANISHAQLRGLANGYDLLRLVIETRKDQLCGLKWNIVGRDDDSKVDGKDKRVQEIEKFLRKPDRHMNFDTWLRALVEDLLVIDAPCVYPRKKVGGGLYSLDIVDGSTIKIIIDADGRIPLHPLPAYRQIIKGMSAVDYTTEELIYSPRNRVSWRHYGYSPVEQILMTVNIALRRQGTQLSYYTEGNVPEALASCPEAWGPEQVAEMQTIWDSLIEGNPQFKRHMRFVPGGIDVKFTREPTLKDTFDEWLARLVCFAFSISPQALIQMMNRATAESAAETAQLEGLAPLQTWVKNFFDDIIETHFGYDDLVFEWDKGEELDPKTQADIHVAYLGAGVLDADEVRKDIGKDPRSEMSNAVPSSVPAVASDQGAASGQPVLGMAQAVAATGDGAATNNGPSAVEGQAPPTADGALPPMAAGAPASGATTVQDTAMNGAQVSSLIALITECAAKALPPETAKAIIRAAFPMVREDLIDDMLTPLKNFEPAAPAAPVDANGDPVVPPGTEAPGKDNDKDADAGSSGDAQTDDAAGASGKKAEKLGKVMHGKARVIAKSRKAIADALRVHLANMAHDIAKDVESYRDNVQKRLAKAGSKPQDKKIDSLLAKFDISFDDIEEELLSSIELVSTSAAVSAVKSLHINGKDALSLANTRAEEWAKHRAAELVKDLVDTTRDSLRSTIVRAEAEGMSNAELAKEIRDNYGFSRQRASTIARTETKSADSEGALEGWRSTGLKMKKEWVRSANDADCDICEANEQQGAIDLDDTFDSGDDTSPAHPNCECAVLSVVDENQED